jgi:hypothetical protein
LWALPLAITMLLRVAYRLAVAYIQADCRAAGLFSQYMPAHQTNGDSSSVGSVSSAKGLALFSGRSHVDDGGGGVTGSATAATTAGEPESLTLTAAGWPAMSTIITSNTLDWSRLQKYLPNVNNACRHDTYCYLHGCLPGTRNDSN